MLSSFASAWLTVKWGNSDSIAVTTTPKVDLEVHQSLDELRSQIRTLGQRLEQLSARDYLPNSVETHPEGMATETRPGQTQTMLLSRLTEPLSPDAGETRLKPATPPQYSNSHTQRTSSQPPAFTHQQSAQLPSQVLTINPTQEQTETYERLNAQLDNPDYLAALNIQSFSIQPEFRSLPRPMQMLLFNKAVQQFDSGKIPEAIFVGR
jgi:hypothetical protein